MRRQGPGGGGGFAKKHLLAALTKNGHEAMIYANVKKKGESQEVK